MRGGLFAVLLAGAACSTVQAQTTAAGVTEPFMDVTLSATVAGTVEKRLVKEGDAIKVGQVLLEMKKRQEELEVKRRKLIADSKAELQAAEARVVTVKTDLDSTRKLFEATKSISKDDLAKKELEFQLSVAEVDRLKMTEDREVIEADMAAELMKDRVITSPVTGHVVEFFRQVGEDCKAQEPLMRVVDTRQFYFISNVEAKAGYNLKNGDTVQLQIEAGSKMIPVTGKISFVSPVVDPASGLLKIKVLCDNANGQVKPGVAGTMQINAQ
ncbi:MAG: Membrane-fusion protein-like protein [Verrucomicrobia bacterium]|nr:Membrane-fusion protein-like protein [Verrucomicrobiota bacterium]